MQKKAEREGRIDTPVMSCRQTIHFQGSLGVRLAGSISSTVSEKPSVNVPLGDWPAHWCDHVHEADRG